MTLKKTNKKEYFVNEILRRLNEACEDILSQWNNPVDTSTRHFLLDDLLPLSDVEEIYCAFPRNGDGFFDRESFREKKRTSSDLSNFEEASLLPMRSP